MLTIRAGHTVREVRGHVKDALERLTTIRSISSPTERASAYQGWGGEMMRTLGSCVSPADMERLVLTPTYWRLMPLSAQEFYGPRSFLLDAEIDHRLAELRDETLELFGLLRGTRRPVAVIDTNVVMGHHADLSALDWQAYVDVFPHQAVRVFVPILVIDELDRLKRSQGTMVLDGQQVQRRTVARQALRTMAAAFPRPGVQYDISGTYQGLTKPVSLELLPDPPGHVRLAAPDAEIRDRALSLQPYYSAVVLVTYDLGNYLAAQTLRLSAHRLVEAEDAAEGDVEPPTTPAPQ